MSFSLRSVVEDPDFTQPCVLRHDQTADTDADGRANFDLGPEAEIELLITSPEATTFAVTSTGQADETAFMACAMQDLGIKEDDRILYDSGFGQQPYRVTEVKPTTFDGDKFAWYRMKPDERGEPGSTPDQPDTGDLVR